MRDRLVIATKFSYNAEPGNPNAGDSREMSSDIICFCSVASGGGRSPQFSTKQRKKRQAAGAYVAMSRRTKAEADMRMLVFVALHFVLSITPTFAGQAEEAFVRTQAGRVIAALANPTIGVADRRAEAEAALDAIVDAERVAMFVLGRYGRTLTGETRSRWVRAYRTHLIAAIVDASIRLGGGRLEVLGSNDRRSGDSIVRARFTPLRGEPADVQWRVVQTAAGLRIVDVEFAGVWLAILQRNEMLAALDQNGGDVLALAALLEVRGRSSVAATGSRKTRRVFPQIEADTRKRPHWRALASWASKGEIVWR